MYLHIIMWSSYFTTINPPHRPPPHISIKHYFNIIWLSLIRVTDWLNTVTWLRHNSVYSPPRSGAAEGEHWSIPQNVFTRGKSFTQTNGKMSLRYYRFKNVCWPRAGCLLRTQYNIYALHCAQLNENPRWTELCEFLQNRAGQGNGEPYNITDGDFVVGNITECS